MAITNGYATLADVKTRLQINDTTDDTVLEAVITAVSRWIDAYCNRRFFAVAETRYYTSIDGIWLHIDDLLSITTLKTDEDGDGVYETTWALTDYKKHPINASLDGWPYTSISVTAFGNRYFPRYDSSVELAGSYGFSATTPPTVNQACLLQSARLFKRKDAVFGVEGSNAMGKVLMMPDLDIDVQGMLDPLRRVLL
jgi:hypothetical protein